MAKSTRRTTGRTARPAAENGATLDTNRARQTAPTPREGEAPPHRASLPFLRAEHVGASGSLKPIQGSTVRTFNGEFGTQLVIDVSIRGHDYSWGIGVDKPNLRLLVEALVNNPGKPIPVVTMISQSNRSYVAIRSDHKNSHSDEIPF